MTDNFAQVLQILPDGVRACAFCAEGVHVARHLGISWLASS
jgi:hypothetical protein